MSDQGERRRHSMRALARPKPPLPSSIKEYLASIEKCVCDADEARWTGDTELALNCAQEALFYAFKIVENHLPAHQQQADRKRLEWIVEFLFMADIFSNEMVELGIALEALDEGETLPLLMPKPGGMRGGKRPTKDRYAMRLAVAAAHVLKEESGGKIESYRAELKACGTAARTIEGYEQKLAQSKWIGQPTRLLRLLVLGGRDPREALKNALAQLTKRQTRVRR